MIKLGMPDCLTLGNLDAKRDWGYARLCFGYMAYVAAGVGQDHKDYVVTNQGNFRVAEVDVLLGDCSKAKEDLHWAPKVYFRVFVAKMVDSDLKIFGGAKK